MGFDLSTLGFCGLLRWLWCPWLWWFAGRRHGNGVDRRRQPSGVHGAFEEARRHKRCLKLLHKAPHRRQAGRQASFLPWLPHWCSLVVTELAVVVAVVVDVCLTEFCKCLLAVVSIVTQTFCYTPNNLALFTECTFCLQNFSIGIPVCHCINFTRTRRDSIFKPRHTF